MVLEAHGIDFFTSDLALLYVETVNGQQIRRKKINLPKALCFDYLMLKDTFGVDLETEVVMDEGGN